MRALTSSHFLLMTYMKQDDDQRQAAARMNTIGIAAMAFRAAIGAACGYERQQRGSRYNISSPPREAIFALIFTVPP